MIPWVELGAAEIPGGGRLRLKRRGQEFSIMLGANELMNSRLSGSEEALADLSLAKLSVPKPHVLVGGLGMGFTLRAALHVLPLKAVVTVAELVPEVVGWARVEMAEIFQNCLDDPRVTVEIADAGALIERSKGAYDAILLDVDNGPEGLSRPQNDNLYRASGLAEAKRAVAPGGILAVWSSAPDRSFTRRLEQAGFDVEEVRVRAHGKGGARHTIWLART